MGQLSLVPNLNLGRLIKDLLNEGGEGLYLRRANGDSNDDDSDGRERGGGGRGLGGGRGVESIALLWSRSRFLSSRWV